MSFDKRIVVGLISEGSKEAMRNLASKLLAATESKEEAAGLLITSAIKAISDILPNLSEAELLRIAQPIIEVALIISLATELSCLNTFNASLDIIKESKEPITATGLMAKLEEHRQTLVKKRRSSPPVTVN